MRWLLAGLLIVAIGLGVTLLSALWLGTPDLGLVVLR